MIRVLGLAGGAESVCRYRAVQKLGLPGVRTYERIETLSYRELLRRDSYRFFHGVYVFTDLPLLAGRQVETLMRIVARLRASPLRIRILNDRFAYKVRFELLRHLFVTGTNRHNIYWADEHRRPASWPVFVRSVLGHWQSPLLYDAEALQRCLDEMTRNRQWLGDKLIVELKDARSADGLYRKYGAFRIGDRIIADHAFIGPHWSHRDADDYEPMLSGRDSWARTSTTSAAIPAPATSWRSFGPAASTTAASTTGSRTVASRFGRSTARRRCWRPGYFLASRALRHPKSELVSERLSMHLRRSTKKFEPLDLARSPSVPKWLRRCSLCPLSTPVPLTGRDSTWLALCTETR
jgi:hypothetical protein